MIKEFLAERTIQIGIVPATAGNDHFPLFD
jgi:hypothetical protein